MSNGSLELFCALFSMLLLIITRRKRYSSRASRINRVILILTHVMLLCDGLALGCFAGNRPVYCALYGIAYLCFFAIAALYLPYLIVVLFVAPNRRVRLLRGLNVAVCALGFLLWVSNCFSPVFVDIQSHVVTSSLLYDIANLPGLASVLLDVIFIIDNRRRTVWKDALLLLLMPLLPVAASALDWFCLPFSRMQYPMIFVSVVLNHFRFDMVMDRKLELEEKQVDELRLRMQLQRVKPHFIYNVMTSIYYLCEKDPAKAQYAISAFSGFLRSTLESMEDTVKVPFDWELALVRNYLKLEQLRFGDRLSVRYDIEASDFALPPFSVQPLVENAVKHGMKTRGGGSIRIAAKAAEGEHVITVSDDGTGFDPDGPEEPGKPSGIRNIRQMLALTDSGTLEVRSAPGRQGTVAILHIWNPRGSAANRQG